MSCLVFIREKNDYLPTNNDSLNSINVRFRLESLFISFLNPIFYMEFFFLNDNQISIELSMND